MTPANDRPPVLDCFVRGTPAPGGSKNVFPMWDRNGKLICKRLANGKMMPVLRVVDDAGAGNKEWRKCVAVQCKAALPPGFQPIADRPLFTRFNFWIQRPQYEFRTNGQLKESARSHHTQKPDLLKLARSTEDAMTGIVWVDDCQVVSQSQTKQFTNVGEFPGCRIRVYLL